jgi:hypothetical protein
VDVLASIDLILAHIAKLHNRPTRRTERSLSRPGTTYSWSAGFAAARPAKAGTTSGLAMLLTIQPRL